MEEDTTAVVAVAMVDATTVAADAAMGVVTMAVAVAVEVDDSMADEVRTITITLNTATAMEAMVAAMVVRTKHRQLDALGVEARPLCM